MGRKEIKIKPGDRYNNLVVIKELNRKNNKRRFLWKCDCGKEHEAYLYNVRHNQTHSCGCKLTNYLKVGQKGSNNPAWKGGRRVDEGYVFIYMPDHPNAKSNGYVREHTLIMSNYLGRPLEKGENIHHKNGVKDDNRLQNLELWSTSQPSGQRVVDKVAWAKEILEKYGEYNEPSDTVL